MSFPFIKWQKRNKLGILIERLTSRDDVRLARKFKLGTKNIKFWY
jgi:hypothetical protein